MAIIKTYITLFFAAFVGVAHFFYSIQFVLQTSLIKKLINEMGGGEVGVGNSVQSMIHTSVK